MSDDKKLIEKAAGGDVEAFEKIIEEYQNIVYSIALRMSGNETDAFDMAQEVFIKLYRNLSKFDGRSKLSTWIYRVASNTCLDELKKRKRIRDNTKSLNEEFEMADDSVVLEIKDTKPLPEEEIENSEIKETLNSAILKLSDQHKEVIILRDIEGFSYEEIADITKNSVGTVKSRLSRARSALRKILKEYGELFEKYFVK